MKKFYETPIIVCEKFQSTEYIAACGDSGTIYNFECTAGIDTYGTRSDGHGWHGRIYKETNGTAGLQTGKRWGNDTNLGGYSACDKKHQAAAADGFSDGYYVPNTDAYGFGSYQYDKAIAVKIWQGDGDLHATEKLDMDSWETAKS